MKCPGYILGGDQRALLKINCNRSRCMGKIADLMNNKHEMKERDVP